MATKKITPASGKVTGTHSNMPLAVIPSEITNFGAITLAEAQSSRFYTDSSLTVEVAREVVSSDELHFKGTSVSSASEFWVDYDGIRADYAVTDTYGRNAVWADYVSVYHMQGNSTDSAGNYNGSDTSMAYGTSYGQIDQGANFSGSGNILLTNNADWGIEYNTAFSASFWFKSTNTGNRMIMGKQVNIASHNTKGWAIMHASPSGGEMYLQMNSGASFSANELQVRTDSAINLVDGTRRHFVVTHSGTGTAAGVNFYVNGSAFAKAIDANTLTATIANTSVASIGSESDQGNRMVGDLDEVRFRRSEVSSDWATTEYQNQNDNGAFWEAEDAGGGGGGWNTYPIIHMLQFNCVM